jgi:outer membrane protein TolC
MTTWCLLRRETHLRISLLVFIALFGLIIYSVTTLPAMAQPLTLSEGLEIVTEENHMIRIKQQEERSAHSDTIVARSRLLPSLTASYGQTFLKNQPGFRTDDAVAWSGEKSFYTYQVAIQQIHL